MNLKRLSLLLIFLCAPSFGYAEATNIAPDTRTALEHPQDFHDIASTKNLPATVMALCLYNTNKMADPGGKWEATDDVSDDSLPRTRLIWAAAKDNLYVVHYEHGGRGHSYHLLVAALQPNGSAKAIWHASVTKALNSLNEVDSALQSNAIDDQ